MLKESEGNDRKGFQLNGHALRSLFELSEGAYLSIYVFGNLKPRVESTECRNTLNCECKLFK